MKRETIGELKLPEMDAPMHERLAEALERQVASGLYLPGDRLPTHREIARRAKVAIGTVTKAIDLLGRRGIVRGEVGRGTFVNAREPAAEGVIDLTINGPAPVIEEDAFAAATALAARRASTFAHAGYADLRGTEAQRATLVDWLSRNRIDLDEREVIVTVGAQHALHLAFADLAATSRLIASEGATFPGAIAAANDLCMQFVPVDHDADGMIAEDLDRVLAESGARILYTTPVCQNPLGIETGEARRRQILAVCERHDALIVEDDIYALYAAKGGLTYKALAPERTYYFTGLSKCLTPVMRVGLLAPPEGRGPAILKRLRAEVWGASPLATEIGCAMIELGIADRVADILRREARERVSLVETILGLPLPMPGGAPHVWMPMDALEAERLARRASERGVRLTPPVASSIGGARAGGIRVCVMAPRERATLERALQQIAALQAEPEEAAV